MNDLFSFLKITNNFTEYIHYHTIFRTQFVTHIVLSGPVVQNQPVHKWRQTIINYLFGQISTWF